MEEATQKATQKTTQIEKKSKEKSRVKSKEKSKEKILKIISENPSVTTQEISEITGLSIPGVEKNIKILKKVGQLLRISPDKGGHWKVKLPK